MVQDEPHAGAPAHHLDGVCQLRVVDADVEAEAVPLQKPDSLDEARLHAKAGGLPLDQAPDALHLGNLRQLVQDLHRGGPVLQGRRRDDALQPRLIGYQRRDPRGLLDLVAMGHVGFQEHDLLDGNIPNGVPVALRRVGPVQQRDLVEPRIPQVPGVPQVNVGIDYTEVEHIEPPSVPFPRAIPRPVAGHGFTTTLEVMKGWRSQE